MRRLMGLVLGMVLLFSLPSLGATPTPRPTVTPGPVNVESTASTLAWVTATGTVTKGRFVNFNGRTAWAVGQPVMGVATRTLSANGKGPVIVAGPAQVQAGNVSFAAGDAVATDATGSAKLCALPADFCIGYATEAHVNTSPQPLKIIVSQGGNFPVTFTPTNTPTSTPTNTPTRTPTNTPTNTPT